MKKALGFLILLVSLLSLKAPDLHDKEVYCLSHAWVFMPEDHASAVSSVTEQAIVIDQDDDDLTLQTSLHHNAFFYFVHNSRALPNACSAEATNASDPLYLRDCDLRI